MSEFLGTILIVAVLWFGGTLILGQNASIDAPTFIFYMAVSYTHLDVYKRQVLYQSGYLTIKRYDEKLGIYRLGFPNREVEEGVVCFLLPYYASVDKVESPFEIQKFVREVRAGD